MVSIKFYIYLLAAGIIACLLCSCETCMEEKPCTGYLVEYKSSNIIGYEDKPVLVDAGFLPVMDKLSDYARQNGLILYVTSSFRKQNQVITNAIVPPAARSNHLVGHAVDINIVYNGVWYESKDMKKSSFDRLPSNAKNFFRQVQNTPGIRWGGNFKPEDPVHIDDGFYSKHPEAWDRDFYAFQEN